MDSVNLVKKSLEIVGGTQRDFADACGVSQGLISQFLSGAKQPGWRTCQKIEQLTQGLITRHQLRPDIFGEEQSENSPPK